MTDSTANGKILGDIVPGAGMWLGFCIPSLRLLSLNLWRL